MWVTRGRKTLATFNAVMGTRPEERRTTEKAGQGTVGATVPLT